MLKHSQGGGDFEICNGIYFSSQEHIAYFLTKEAVYLLVHFKFLRVQQENISSEVGVAKLQNFLVFKFLLVYSIGRSEQCFAF